MPNINKCHFCTGRPLLTFTHVSTFDHRSNVAKVTSIRNWWTYDDKTLKQMVRNNNRKILKRFRNAID